jgi:hypothetical protein
MSARLGDGGGGVAEVGRRRDWPGGGDLERCRVLAADGAGGRPRGLGVAPSAGWFEL